MKERIKNKIVKSISVILIVSVLMPSILFLRPQKAEAFVFHDPIHSALTAVNKVLLGISTGSTVQNTAISLKNMLLEIAKQVMRMFIKRMLQQMTQQTVKWINSGFHGSPLFVQNPESFFKDVGKFEIRNLVDSIGYDTLGQPFGKNFALNIINSYKRTFEENAQYSLSRVMNDPQLMNNYRNNFNTGGWNGFLINTQHPQNNYVGYQLMMTDVLAQRLKGTTQTAAQKVQTTLQQGSGFLSPKICPTNSAYNNMKNEFQQPTFKPTVTYDQFAPDLDASLPPGKTRLDLEREARDAYQTALDREKAEWTKNNTCPGGLVATTPGTVVANQITTSLTSGLRQGELESVLGGDLTKSIAAVLDALLNKLMEKGLSGLTSLVSPKPSIDNWSYEGNTLSGSGSGGGNQTGNLAIPTDVTVDIGTSTSTTISGGVAPYSISINSDSSIARVDISGNIITVTGVARGTTSFTVQDSSNFTKLASVQILVRASGDLLITPPKVVFNIDDIANNSINVAISGGKEPYSIETSPSSSVVMAVFGNTSISIAAVGKGTTSLTVTDSSQPQQTFTLPITVNGPSALTVSSKKVSVEVGQTDTISVSGGTGPYKTSGEDPSLVTIQPSGNSDFTLTGVAPGETSVVIQDSSSQVINVTISVTSNNGGTNSTGICQKNLLPIPNMTQAMCDQLGGTWEPY